MKTSRTNSFRLHLINKTGSLRKASQTFYDPDETVKFAALNSVNRGVKHADLSYLTGKDLNKLRVEPLEPNEGQYNSAHFNLSQCRKKYDEMKKQRVSIEQAIENMKEQIGKFTIFRDQYEYKINQAKTKAAKLKEQLEQKKNLLQVTETEKKVLLNLQLRHKTDKIYYDQRKFDAEQQLIYLRKQLNIYKKDGHGIDESEDRTAKIYQKLAQELERQRFERQEHIRHLEDMIQEKLRLVQNNEQRFGQLNEIAQRAIQDKDGNQKNWRKIFLTHIFVNKMLRNKIQKQMQKFKIVQFAFKQIKTATGVNDAKTLVHKYLNKEAVYGELLGKIAENEKTIEKLKSETQALNHESKSLEMQLQVLQSVKIKSLDLHQNIKSFEQHDEKATIANSYQNKCGQWVMRQLKKLSAIDKKHEEFQKPKNNAKLVELLNKYLNIIREESQKVQEIQQLKIREEDLNTKDFDKNTRVIAKKSRLNSRGQQIYDVEQQQTHHNSQNQQHQVINNQRDQILRNNEKFMKQIKKKMDEQRKILVQKHEAKTKSPVKVQQAKPNAE